MPEFAGTFEHPFSVALVVCYGLNSEELQLVPRASRFEQLFLLLFWK